jgi:quercetin dioxygenase-like cupin family protein
MVAAVLVAACMAQAQTTLVGSTSAPAAGPKPLLLEEGEGEQRLWRPEPGEVGLGGFILKVTPKSNGSQHLMLVTEDLAPGDAIPTHKHLEQDEIVLIEKGTIHAHVGDRERDLHAGGMVFIPMHTWVSFKNAGTEIVSIAAIFSRPDSRIICGANRCRQTKNRLPFREQKRTSVITWGTLFLQGPGRKGYEFRAASEPAAKILLLEKDEGEQRLFRPEPGEVGVGGFNIKVSPKNNGSRHLVVFTGEAVPGDAIPTHKNLEQDEILLIEKGTAHVQVGDQERDLHAGGMVFIPANTWVGAKITGTEAESDVAIFSSPGFEDHLRCESVPAKEKPTAISRAEENKCDHLGHVVYKDRGEVPSN